MYQLSLFFYIICTCVANSHKQSNEHRGLHMYRKLSNPESYLSTIQNLYKVYGEELVEMHKNMRPWCKATQSCKFCDHEVELLYMSVREWNPANMFEMAPNKGYSTSWILAAMQKNGNGVLHSFDIQDQSLQHVNEELRGRWNFTKANVMDLYEQNPKIMEPYDFIFIDALHTEEFAKFYTYSLLSHEVFENVPVIIHDIVARADGGGRESMNVYQYLAYSNTRFVFNIAKELSPTPYNAVQHGLEEVDKIREDVSIKGHQKYFECTQDPSIFFVKRSKHSDPNGLK